jgi:hypothetical protein
VPIVTRQRNEGQCDQHSWPGYGWHHNTNVADRGFGHSISQRPDHAVVFERALPNKGELFELLVKSSIDFAIFTKINAKLELLPLAGARGNFHIGPEIELPWLQLRQIPLDVNPFVLPVRDKAQCQDLSSSRIRRLQEHAQTGSTR